MMTKTESNQRLGITKKSFLELTEQLKEQQESKNVDVPMHIYICQGCQRQLYDMDLYFYGTASTKCLWCSKFPKQKQKR